MVDKNQLIVLGLAILGIIIVWNVIKGIIRTVITVCLIIACVFAYMHFTPSQVQDVTKMASQGVQTVQQIKDLAGTTDMVKVDTTNGFDVKFKVADTWISTKDVKEIVSINGNKATIVVAGKSIEVDNQDVIKLLQLIKK